MESNHGEILALQNEIQRSNSLKDLEILALQDKLQETRTTLMDFQNRNKEKFEEQEQKLKSYKTKVEEYKEETVSLKRQMQEMRVSSGRLLDLNNSTRCLQLRTDFDNSAKGQEQAHTSSRQSMQHRQNNSRKEEWSEQQQDPKSLHQQVPSSLGCYKTNTPAVAFVLEEKTSSNTSGDKGAYGERVSAETPMGLVEVLEPHGRVYFTAFLIDIHKSGKQKLVRYENDTEPTWVDAARVHARPPPMTPQEMTDYDPPVGARVEVLFTDEQESWWEGEVLRKRGGFFLISFPEEGEMVVNEVVERERLRPLHNASSPASSQQLNRSGWSATATAVSSREEGSEVKRDSTRTW